MFSDEQLEVISVESSWKKDIYVRDNQAQTKDLPVNEVAVQTVRRKQKEVQTEEQVEEEIEISEDHSEAFCDFIRSVGPVILQELTRNSTSSVFDGYNPFLLSEDKGSEQVHTLSNSDFTGLYQVSGLAWNATGAVIAASFARSEHEGWCTHKGCISTWNLDLIGSGNHGGYSKPTSTIEVASCVTCISAHPVKPAVFAGGTASGEVVLWTTGEDEETVLATSGIGDDSHKEPVTSIRFIQDTQSQSKKLLVVSVGADGYVLLWQIKEHKHQLKLMKGFALLAESLPRELRLKAKSTRQEVGASSVSFSPTDPTVFLLGAESGSIFKCSTTSKGTPVTASDGRSVSLVSPVVLAYAPHSGPILDVQFSPFHRNLLLTSSADTTLRVYSILELEPLMSIAPSQGYLYAAQWSPARPTLFAVATEMGQLLLYDIMQSRSVPAEQIEVTQSSNSQKPCGLRSLQFNVKNPNMIAVGDSLGKVYVYRLRQDFAVANPSERDVLEELDLTGFKDHD